MSPLQLLRIVLARKWLVVASLLVCTAAGTVVTLFFIPKQFTADASMVMDIRPDPLLGALAPGLTSPAYMATQIEILRSERVAMQVVKLLKLAESPDAVNEWRKETEGKMSLERFYAALLLRGLSIEPSRGTNLITLTFVSSDAAFAATAVNAFAQAYMDTSVELRVEPTRQSADWLDDQAKTLRINLEEAQARLSAFQQEKGIVSTDDRLDQETARLTLLNGQLAAAQMEQVEAISRQRNTGSDMSPEVQQSGAVQAVKSQLSVAEARLSEISSVVGVNHPQRVQLEAQIAQLRQQLSREIARVSGSTGVASRSSSQKVAEMRALVEAQKRRILAMTSERDQMQVLQREVEAARRAFDNTSTRAGQLTMEGRNTQAAVRLLTPAVEPLYPSRPNSKKNVAASVLLGLLLGVALAVGLEFFNRRIRGVEDMTSIPGVPMLGVLRPADSKKPVYRQLGHGRPPPSAPLGLPMGGSTS